VECCHLEVRLTLRGPLAFISARETCPHLGVRFPSAEYVNSIPSGESGGPFLGSHGKPPKLDMEKIGRRPPAGLVGNFPSLLSTRGVLPS